MLSLPLVQCNLAHGDIVMPKKSPQKSTGKPRYKQLAETLIQDIQSGRLALGDRLPGEHELVAAHNVSRHTVRESLRMLEDLGLIDRQQGLGTVVQANRADESYVQVLRSPADLMQYPAESRLSVLGSEPVTADRSLAKVLSCRKGETWQRIRTVRKLSTTGVAICSSDIYVVPEYASVAKKISRSRRPVYEIIERTFDERIKSVEVDFRAGLVSAQVAEALEVEAGIPSLTLVRRYVGRSGKQFEVSVAEHPAENFSYTLKLTRGWLSGDGWSES